MELEKISEHMAMMRELLLERLSSRWGKLLKVHGPRDPDMRLPNTLSIGLRGLDARTLLEGVRILREIAGVFWRGGERRAKKRKKESDFVAEA